MPRYTTNESEIAKLLNTVLTTEQVSGIIDALLSCDCDERLTDSQAELGVMLFDQLCHYNPDAVTVAQGGVVA